MRRETNTPPAAAARVHLYARRAGMMSATAVRRNPFCLSGKFKVERCWTVDRSAGASTHTHTGEHSPVGMLWYVYDIVNRRTFRTTHVIRMGAD